MLDEKTLSSRPSYSDNETRLLERIAALESELARQKEHVSDLEEAAHLHRAIIESSRDFIFVINSTLCITYMNPHALKFAARTIPDLADRLIGMPLPDFLSADQITVEFNDTSSIEDLMRAFETGESVYTETKVSFAQHTVWLGTWLLPKLEEGNAIIGIARDITNRRKVEEDLRRSQERLAVALASIGEAVIASDVEGNIVAFNGVAEALTGWRKKEAIGQPVGSVFRIINEKTRQPTENPLQALSDQEAAIHIEGKKLIACSGQETLISYTLAPIRSESSTPSGSVLVFRDVSKQRTLEEEMRRAQKLESVGLLAGGIAHDFNNILTAVMGNLSLAQRRIKKDDAVTARLADAERAVMRARDLTNQLLTFSKGGTPIKILASARTIIEESAEFALSGSSVKCTMSIPKSLWSVEVDEGQISQVIQNLVINANHAMPDGGTIAISAKNITVAPKDKLPLETGRYVHIAVKDTGVGIPKPHLGKVFDPYFTTKENGTGLGLATTYSIMRRHNGHITVDSEPGVGTVFHMYLPATDKHASGAFAPVHSQILGHGYILVMDDDATIRKTAREILKEIGFDVALATDGAEAIKLYKTSLLNGTKFDAVIMDLTIPGGMGGKEAIKVLKQIDPQAKVIVSSGYSNDPIMSTFGDYGFIDRVTKPYGVDQLAKTLDKVMRK
ncbi:MAG: PAS domain S-box protein [Myxococcota bacterium]|nr:PAS domain S-box protein [Myxococcota bacterium]